MGIGGISNIYKRIDEITGKINGLLKQAQNQDFEKILEEASFTKNAPAEFQPAFDRAMAKYHLQPGLLEAVARRESNFNPQAVSPAGAQGIMQIMPGTQRELGVTDPFDAEQSIDGGAKYLRMMLDRFDGNLQKALAAYNAGPHRVEQYKGIPPFPETLNYVSMISSDLE